ncbi:unnamed protein product [Cercospora beticola]|nr:unnamed protein product [Cercospora beticola]
MPAMDIVIIAADEVVEDHDQKDAVETRERSAQNVSDIVLRTRRRSSVAKPPTKSKKDKQKTKQKQKQVADAVLATAGTETAEPESMLAAARPIPLLVCSIGNPGAQYANTLHSAGHTVLNRLASHLGYGQYTKEKIWGKGLVSRPATIGDSGNWVLWQSTDYMNESGKGVKAAYQAWNKNLPDGNGKLVVVHDELEKPLGAVNVKIQQGLSARGHNGLKSIMSTIGNTPFVRIGIGIGRPVSRESDDVARYVLKKMDEKDKAAVEGSVEQVVAQLKKLESG